MNKITKEYVLRNPIRIWKLCGMIEMNLFTKIKYTLIGIFKPLKIKIIDEK